MRLILLLIKNLRFQKNEKLNKKIVILVEIKVNYIHVKLVSKIYVKNVNVNNIFNLKIY